MHFSTFNGLPAFSYSIKSQGFEGPLESYSGYKGIYQVAWLFNNKNYLMIAWNETPEINQVIPTFRLSDVSHISQTTNWLTYSNSKYGFNLKYPQGWYVSGEPENTLYLTNYDITKASSGELNNEEYSQSFKIDIFVMRRMKKI